MSTGTSSELATLVADLEGLWRHVDELFATLGPGDWSRKHGKDWTFADVPYHLAYFDRDLIARGIERGENVPEDQRHLIRSYKELDAWNAARFAERPAGQTPEQSLAQMRGSRDAIRRAVAGLGDADLERPVWMPLLGTGWTTVRAALEMCRAHTWGEATQLRLRMKRSAPLPAAAATHRALGFYVGLFPVMLDRGQAAGRSFTAVIDLTGPGGGAWTVRVADGQCQVSEGRAARADLVMTQSIETFLKTLTHMHNPMVAMLTGKVKVKGWRRLGTFAKLFPPPKPHTVLAATAA